MISAFLESNWTTYDGEYYLNFYEEDDDGSTWSEFNLPWAVESKGTEYYDIVSGMHIWAD